MLDERQFLRERENRSYPNLRGKRVLIVEDDPVIAVDYHFQLKDVGATAEGFKATNRDALTYLLRTRWMRPSSTSCCATARENRSSTA